MEYIKRSNSTRLIDNMKLPVTLGSAGLSFNASEQTNLKHQPVQLKHYYLTEVVTNIISDVLEIDNADLKTIQFDRDYHCSIIRNGMWWNS